MACDGLSKWLSKIVELEFHVYASWTGCSATSTCKVYAHQKRSWKRTSQLELTRIENFANFYFFYKKDLYMNMWNKFLSYRPNGIFSGYARPGFSETCCGNLLRRLFLLGSFVSFKNASIRKRKSPPKRKKKQKDRKEKKSDEPTTGRIGGAPRWRSGSGHGLSRSLVHDPCANQPE